MENFGGEPGATYSGQRADSFSGQPGAGSQFSGQPQYPGTGSEALPETSQGNGQGAAGPSTAGLEGARADQPPLQPVQPSRGASATSQVMPHQQSEDVLLVGGMPVLLGMADSRAPLQHPGTLSGTSPSAVPAAVAVLDTQQQQQQQKAKAAERPRLGMGSPVSKAVLDHLRQYDRTQMRNMLTNYYRQLKGKFKVPIFAHQELDLAKVFWEVQDRGGYELVTSLKLWKDVCRSLNVDLRGQTSASYNMRLNYEKCLLEFERYCASGQYEADVANGCAPSPDTINQPIRLPGEPRSKPHQAGSSSSPAVSGLTGGCGSEHGGATGLAGFSGITLKIGGQPAVRLPGYAGAVPEAQLQYQQQLLPLQMLAQQGAVSAAPDQGGFAGSFTELLAGDDTLLPKLPPSQEPWLRLVAPPGTAGQAGTPTRKGWVAQTDVPPVVFAEPGLYQQLQPLPTEAFGAFLARQGAGICGLRLLRLSPESGAWAEVEVKAFNPEAGSHALQYGDFRAEWASLAALSDAELRPHPSCPVPPYSNSAELAAVAAAAAAGNGEANKGGQAPALPNMIMQALLQGQSPEALHQWVDLAARHLQAPALQPPRTTSHLSDPSAAPQDSGGQQAASTELSGGGGQAPAPGGATSYLQQLQAAQAQQLAALQQAQAQGGEPASLAELAAQLQQSGVEAPQGTGLLQMDAGQQFVAQQQQQAAMLSTAMDVDGGGAAAQMFGGGAQQAAGQAQLQQQWEAAAQQGPEQGPNYSLLSNHLAEQQQPVMPGSLAHEMQGVQQQQYGELSAAVRQAAGLLPTQVGGMSPSEGGAEAQAAADPHAMQ